MRLFTAINLNDEIKDGLCGIMRHLKEGSAEGNFSHRDNLHLTLVFLGEIPPAKTDLVKKAMDGVKEKEFELSLSGFGNFSDILWVGVNKNEALTRLQKALSEKLRNAGFIVENREFKPHLTICRRAVLPAGFDKAAFRGTVGAMSMRVSHFDLMKSERIAGRMVYTAIHTAQLDANAG